MTTTTLQLIQSVRCFKSLLEESFDNDSLWRKLSAGISRHGLLSFTVAEECSGGVPEIDPTRLEQDRNYRRLIARRLVESCRSEYRHTTIPLNRFQLNESEYRNKIAGILGFRWAEKMDTDDPAVQLTLMNITPAILLECLHQLRQFESNAQGVSDFILRHFVDELMAVDTRFEELASPIYELEEHYKQQFAVRIDAISKETKLKFDALEEDTNRKYDALSARLAPQ